MPNMVGGQRLTTKPKLIIPSDSQGLRTEKTNYNVLDLWKRVNRAETELNTLKGPSKSISILRWKNWRIHEVGTDLILENYAGSAWTEDTRWTP